MIGARGEDEKSLLRRGETVTGERQYDSCQRQGFVNGEHVEEIENRYWLHIAIIAETVLHRAVAVLNVLSGDVSDSAPYASPVGNPTWR